MAELDIRPVRGRAPGDDYFRRHGGDDGAMATETESPSGRPGTEVARVNADPLDAQEVRDELRRLLEWFYYEKDKQAPNRLEMATDHDFYDNMQWDADDAQTLRDRGQMPLVYNEVAPMCDWVIGTQLRASMDWNILPRTEEQVGMADVKKKTLKYVADVNQTQMVRSRAFADAIKGGVGWVDDGVRDDPTKEIIYSKYEDWRNVLWDSDSYDLDLDDARYLFRWRWVDEDIAVAMFPHRKSQIRSAVEDSMQRAGGAWEEESWYDAVDPYGTKTGTLFAHGSGMMVDAKRRRVRLIECQYRMPETVKVVDSGSMAGQVFNDKDMGMAAHVTRENARIIDKVLMRVRVAVFTENAMLAMGTSIYRHNKFSLTPIWCYRRNRDRLPYGIIRRVRDVQQDMNKRASKALFYLNTNQIVAEEGATDDWDSLADEVSRPDGRIIHKVGKKLEIRRDTTAAAGQIEMMSLAANSIQRSGGVADENMGRQTNAVSGEAIKARQLQGSVVTTEPFSNLRYMTQVQGEKQLSLVEQWFTTEKVIRLTGHKGKLEWVKLNVPELQPDGSYRIINDITASMADFKVDEQDYAGSLRQVMFDSLTNIAQKQDPQIAMRLMTMAFEFSDLPNKDEIAEQFRKITGERDDSKPLTPEEEQAQMEQQALQKEAVQVQRETALLALQEQQAKIRELNAKASKLEREAIGMDAEGREGAEALVQQVRADAMKEIERLSEQLRKATVDSNNAALKINKDADIALEVARINADSDERVAEIKARSDAHIARMTARIDDATPSKSKKTATA